MTTTMDPSELHRAATVVDAHNDLLCPVVARPPDQWSSFFRERWLPQLLDGGVDVQVLPVWIDPRFQPEGALRETLRMIECAHRIAEDNPDAVALCRDGEEISAALASGRIALVLAMESAPGVDQDVELFHTMHRLGVRVVSIAHFGRTALADGSGEDATGGRLTSAGVAAVAELERLGILFDVSHLGAAGVEHVLELATRPVVATHSAARALHDHHRNLTDAQLRGIAATGGVVCVNFFAPFLHDTDHTIARLGDHIEHVAGVAGIRHVGLGPDFILEFFEDLRPAWCEESVSHGVDLRAHIPGLSGPRGLPQVTAELARRGWPETDITAVLGENLLRLFKQELGVPGTLTAGSDRGV